MRMRIRFFFGFSQNIRMRIRNIVTLYAEFDTCALKGTVPRNGGRNEPMEQQVRPKIMFANPFFRLKSIILS
jgi:hypothetical protein